MADRRAYHPLIKLAKTHPYTVRRRLLDVLKANGASVCRTARVLDMDRRRLYLLLRTVGIASITARMRRQVVIENRIAHQLEWSLHGNMLKRTPEWKAKYAAAQRAKLQPPEPEPPPIPRIRSRFPRG